MLWDGAKLGTTSVGGGQRRSDSATPVPGMGKKGDFGGGELRQVIRAANRKSGPSILKKSAALLFRHGVSPKRAIGDYLYRRCVSVYHISKMEQYYDRRNRNGFRFFMSDRRLVELLTAYRGARKIHMEQEGAA